MELDSGYYGSPRWSYEILDCAMPMTFDTYSNCAHQCVYCFAFFQRAIGASADDYLHHRVRAVNVERVKQMFLNPDEKAGQFAGYIKNRFVLQWGGLSDGFDWYERKFRKSLELLRFFREIDYPISISTKGTWFLDDPEYVEVIRGATNTHWKYSIITLDSAKARKLESGTPTPQARFDALRRLYDLGVGATTLRYRPFIIGASEDHIEPMVRMAKDIGCTSVTTEFLCIEKRAGPNHHARYNQISEVVGYDVWDYYRKNSYSGSGLMRLNYDIKRPYIQRFENICRDVGLPFYVSDAHHKEASAGAGCCGLPTTGPLSVYNKGQYAEAILIAKREGKVQWTDIASDAAWLKEIPYAFAEAFNTGGTRNRAYNFYHSMFDFMHDTWNRPASWSSPARYFGGALVPGDLDANGDIVYLYNKPFVEDGTRVQSVRELKILTGVSTDELRADGNDAGHVAFPIYVISTQKWKTATTPKFLRDSRLNYTLVVEPGEAVRYQEYYPEADILIVPRDNYGLSDTRQFVKDFVASSGDAQYWLLDDGIKNVSRYVTLGSAEKKPASMRAALSYVEGLVSQFSGVAVAALDWDQSAWHAREPYSINARALILSLLRADTPIAYDSRFSAGSEIAYLVAHLVNGWRSLLIHQFAFALDSIPGLRNEEALLFASLYPDLSRIVDKGDKGQDVVIKWGSFAPKSGVTD